MKDMKQLINKWGESMLFSLLMALCLTWTFTACSDDKDNEYISDTQLSILEDNRTSLSYLLKKFWKVMVARVLLSLLTFTCSFASIA